MLAETYLNELYPIFWFLEKERNFEWWAVEFGHHSFNYLILVMNISGEKNLG